MRGYPSGGREISRGHRRRGREVSHAHPWDGREVPRGHPWGCREISDGHRCSPGPAPATTATARGLPRLSVSRLPVRVVLLPQPVARRPALSYTPAALGPGAPLAALVLPPAPCLALFPPRRPTSNPNPPSYTHAPPPRPREGHSRHPIGCVDHLGGGPSRTNPDVCDSKPHERLISKERDPPTLPSNLKLVQRHSF